MLLALLLALFVALALIYFAKSVLVRTPIQSSESAQSSYASSSGVSSDKDHLRKRSTNAPKQSGEQTTERKTIMQPPLSDLALPKDDPFTREQLKAFDGSDPSKPIYVAIKGTVFDVTRKVDVYGKGKSYNLFAGKDASRALGKSSLKEEDAVSDYSTLSEGDMKTLDDWHEFFLKRYNIVGKVIDLPPMSNLSPPSEKAEDPLKAEATDTSSAL